MDKNMDRCWKSTWPNRVSSQHLGIFATAWGCQLKTLGEDRAAAYSTFFVHTVVYSINQCVLLSRMPAIVVSEADTVRCKASQDTVGGAAFLSFKLHI